MVYVCTEIAGRTGEGASKALGHINFFTDISRWTALHFSLIPIFLSSNQYGAFFSMFQPGDLKLGLLRVIGVKLFMFCVILSLVSIQVRGVIARL